MAGIKESQCSCGETAEQVLERVIAAARGEADRWWSVLYSYPTWDKNYRGRRGVRVFAHSEEAAIGAIRRGYDGYPPCPDAQIVRCELSRRQD